MKEFRSRSVVLNIFQNDIQNASLHKLHKKNLELEKRIETLEKME
jgi:hypothetical protein